MAMIIAGEPIVYPLKHPIETTFRPNGGEARTEVLSEVTMRRPKARDLRVLDRYPGKIAQALALIQTLSGLNQAQVDELDAEDVTGLSEIVGDFLPDTPTTGAASSGT
jgi:hypothetical protein